MFVRSIAIAGCLAVLAFCGVTAAAQGPEELRCRAMLDGQVAWNQSGDNAWQPGNIEALCTGATDADARIACFEAGIAAHNDWSRAIAECTADDGAAAMPPPAAREPAGADAASEEMRCRAMVDGRVAWNRGGDTAWQPANIEALCAGATDAEARIACFEAGIRAHDDWNRAISDCAADDEPRGQTPKPEAEAEPAAPTPQSGATTGEDPPETALCKKMFQGNIPMSMPNGSKTWDEARLERLCAGSVNAMETLKCFIEALGNGGSKPLSTDEAIEACRAR